MMPFIPNDNYMSSLMKSFRPDDFHFVNGRYSTPYTVENITLASALCKIHITRNKQDYALKNWVEGLSDEAYYPSRYLITGKVPKKIAWACDWYRLKAHIF